jgi:hypothetical protein
LRLELAKGWNAPALCILSHRCTLRRPYRCCKSVLHTLSLNSVLRLEGVFCSEPSFVLGLLCVRRVRCRSAVPRCPHCQQRREMHMSAKIAISHNLQHSDMLDMTKSRCLEYYDIARVAMVRCQEHREGAKIPSTQKSRH